MTPQEQSIGESVIRSEVIKRQRTLPPWIDLDDLQQAAWVAYMEALSRYDPSRSLLRPYATRVVRWRVADYLRATPIVGIVRTYADDVEGMTQKRAKEEMSKHHAVQWDHARNVQRAREEKDFVDECIRGYLDGHIVSRIVEHRTRKHRRYDVLYRWAHGETLMEIGKSYGVTEARACQLRGEAIRHLRKELAA